MRWETTFSRALFVIINEKYAQNMSIDSNEAGKWTFALKMCVCLFLILPGDFDFSSSLIISANGKYNKNSLFREKCSSRFLVLKFFNERCRNIKDTEKLQYKTETLRNDELTFTFADLVLKQFSSKCFFYDHTIY